MNAVIYARFSSDMQNETSIEAQLHACKEYASKNGFPVVGEYIDRAVSGKNTNRAQYQKMMRDARTGKFQRILIHKQDRIARNLGDHINLRSKLQEYGIDVVAVAQDFGDGKEAKLMTAIQWALSEYYEDNLAEETRKGHKMIAIKGLHNGGVAPFGYDIVNQKYVINPIEAGYVQRIFQACVDKTGYRDVLKDMNDNGIVGKRGKPMRYSSIYEILHNEKYTGTYVYSEKEETERKDRREKPNAIRVEGAIPQIVPLSVFLEARQVMESRKNDGPYKTYKCSGLMYCGQCGGKMYMHSQNCRGHRYKYYICENHCGTTIKEETANRIVDLFIQRMLTDEVKGYLQKKANQYAQNEERMVTDFEKTRKEKLEEVKKQIDNLTANLASGVLPEDVTKVIAEKISDLKKEETKIKRLVPIREYTAETIDGWIQSLIKCSEGDLPNLIIEKIVIKQNSAKVVSTLAKLCEKTGCGDTQPSLRTTLLPIFYGWLCDLELIS